MPYMYGDMNLLRERFLQWRQHCTHWCWTAKLFVGKALGWVGDSFAKLKFIEVRPDKPRGGRYDTVARLVVAK